MTVAAGFVHPGTLSTGFVLSLRATAGVAEWLDQRSGPNVARARNILVERFLATTHEWLWMVDTDMTWSPDALDRLMDDGKDVVGGLCFGVGEGRLIPTIFDTITLAGEDVIVRVESYPRDRLVSCAATGAAFLLIHRSVLEAVRDREFSAAFPWFQETERDGYPVGEDVTFCLRAGECGHRVHVDTRVKVGHVKAVTVTEATFDAQEA